MERIRTRRHIAANRYNPLIYRSMQLHYDPNSSPSDFLGISSDFAFCYYKRGGGPVSDVYVRGPTFRKLVVSRYKSL